MKSLIIAALALISLTACERRYSCVETQTITTATGTTVFNTARSFTGTKKEMEKWRSDNTKVESNASYKMTTYIDCK